MPRVEYEDVFSADLSAELSYLRARQERAWITNLHDDLAELTALLTHFPEAGRELARKRTVTLRKLRLRRAPFYIWYTFDSAIANGPVRFLRLFHVRQRTPEPRLP